MNYCRVIYHSFAYNYFKNSHHGQLFILHFERSRLFVIVLNMNATKKTLIISQPLNRMIIFFPLLTLLSGCASRPNSSTSVSDISTSEELSIISLILNVNIPIDIDDATSSIKIAGNMNAWNPLDGDYQAQKVDEYNYSLRLEFPLSDIGLRLEYKYVLVYNDQTDNPWANVEGGPTGNEIANRHHTLIKGEQTVNDIVSSFKNHLNQSSLTRGRIVKVILDMPQYNDSRKRTIRIWLPDGYDVNSNKRYPVIYMHDGQNLFDDYTSFSGEWKIDESIGTMMDGGYEGTIVVGIDNSSDRLNEYSPAWPRSSEGSAHIQNPSGEKYAQFVVQTVKPYIDANFNTNPDKEATGIGGSSMGGVISFYMALTYPEVFGYALLFSTAMWVYQSEVTTTFLDGASIANFESYPRLYLYAGGLEPDVTPFVASISKALIDRGYPETKIASYVDQNRGHNEAAWSHYFPIGYRWLVEF